MDRSLRVLMVEDSLDDSELLLKELERGGYRVTHERTQTAEGMQRALDTASWDIILADYAMPTFGAMEALSILKESKLDIPFIIVSRTIDEEGAIQALKAGAADFLNKHRLTRLLPALERGLREAAGRFERRRAEQALRESEEKYRKIVETAHEGIWMVDRSAKTTFINNRMALMLGYSTEELIGRSMLDFLEDEWEELVLRNIKHSPFRGAVQYDFRFRRRDGSEFWASISGSPMFDSADQYWGALIMVTDVTEQRRLQAQLITSDRMASVGTLAAGVAHEINNPLSAVLANLDLAARTMEGAEHNPGGVLSEVTLMIRDAREAAEYVRNAMRDLSIFSRPDDDKRGPTNVQQVLDSSIRMLWNEIRHRAKLIRSYESIPAVEGNEARLGQVFLNLLVNAVHAIPEGSVDNHEIRVATRLAAEGYVAIEIYDTGCGMSQEALKRVFTPFFSTKPTGVGTGLGLSICYRIVSSIGGKIEVQSEVGQGTVVRVLLPCANYKTAPEAVRPLAPAQGARKRGRVLVIDDEPMVASAIHRTLEGEHDVVTVTSGEEALTRMTRGEEFDVILCDLMMPHMPGIDIYQRVRELAPTQLGRIIFMTGGPFTPRARSFLERSHAPLLEKPFEPASLRNLVSEMVH